MREARIILATETRHNTPINASIRALLQNKLATAFGGYTETAGFGGYRMDSGDLKHELVLIYDVAIEPHHWPALTAIAMWLCHVADQETVYARRDDGVVFFYDAGFR